MRWERFNPFGLAFVTGVLTVVVFACAPANPPAPTVSTPPVHIVEPIDRSNGVFYFPVTGESYIGSLSKFYEQKPHLHCDLQGSTERIIQQNNRNGTKYAETTGFILHCHDIAINAQDVTLP